MANNTNITLTGRLGADPTNHSTGTQSICTFRLGSSRGYYDRNRQIWRDQPTTWVTVKTYRNLAANVSRSLHKGDPVIVSGYLVTEEWADRRTGERRSMNVIEATSIGHDIAQGISLFSRVNPSAGFAGRRREEQARGEQAREEQARGEQQSSAGAQQPPGAFGEFGASRQTAPAGGEPMASPWATSPSSAPSADASPAVTASADAPAASAPPCAGEAMPGAPASGAASAPVNEAIPVDGVPPAAGAPDGALGGAAGGADGMPMDGNAATVPDEFGTNGGGDAY